MNHVVKTSWLILCANSLLAAAGPAMKCDALAGKAFGDDVTIHSAALVAAKGDIPEHCDVRGTIWPEAGFAIKLPTAWNDRFQMVGNGGTAGTISLGAVDSAVRNGFAAASTDTGHDAAKDVLAAFAYVTAGNPNGHRKFLDYAYLAVHETAVLAKQVIGAYYGAAPRYSYWVGCSTGGRQGLQEAQRYPEDFDGLAIGAPVLYTTGNSMRRVWIAQSQVGAGAIPEGKLPLLTKAIYEKCDALDGLKDGLIDDPRVCRFEPARDVAKCTGGDAADCFTAGQIEALGKIYGGVRDSKGRLLFPGELVGGEPGWADNIIAPDKTAVPRTESQMQFEMLDPPPGASWKLSMFNFDTDPARLVRAAAELNALNPDLAPLKKRGGKIVQYAGWADQQVNPLPGIEYYGAVSQRMGEAETRDFYRVFMVPGMYHCNGGPGCNTADWLAAAMDWVENGKAPAQITGAHVEGGKTTRTRPLCAYPGVARYRGTGSIDEAANFECASVVALGSTPPEDRDALLLSLDSAKIAQKRWPGTRVYLDARSDFERKFIAIAARYDIDPPDVIIVKPPLDRNNNPAPQKADAGVGWGTASHKIYDVVFVTEYEKNGLDDAELLALLAHEMGHVVQFKKSGRRSYQQGKKIEGEADKMALSCPEVDPAAFQSMLRKSEKLNDEAGRKHPLLFGDITGSTAIIPVSKQVSLEFGWNHPMTATRIKWADEEIKRRSTAAASLMPTR